MPSTEPFSRPTLALKDPALDQEGFFVALSEDDSFIGMSNLSGLWFDRQVRAYRRHGIATALKMRTILFARSAGAETIETSNEEDKSGFSSLNFNSSPASLRRAQVTEVMSHSGGTAR